MRPTAPLQVWQDFPIYDAECSLQQRKICNSKTPLERIRVDKVAQQIIIQSLHSSTGALDLVEIVIAVNLDPFCLLTNVSPLFRLTSDEVWRT